MAYNFTKFYQLGSGENLVFQKDLEELSVYLNRPFPEFFGAQLNDQPGGELQWKIVADLRGKMEPPTSEMIRFSLRENNWMDGLARAMQEALARLCGQNVSRLKHSRFIHYARHDSMGEPMDMSPHSELKYHVEHLDYMLHETRKELDNARAHANAAIEFHNADFLFPQMQLSFMGGRPLPCVDPNWKPQFFDYLYLSFTNSTAFSPADVMPISRWSKALMLVEALGEPCPALQ